MPTLEDIHARWAKVSPKKLAAYITALRRTIERSEENVLPRSRTSLAASTKRSARSDSVSEVSSGLGDANSPPPDVLELTVFLSQKALLLELYAVLTARNRLTAMEKIIASGVSTPEIRAYRSIMAAFNDNTGTPLVCGVCRAQLRVPRTNTSLRSDAFPCVLDSDPLSFASPHAGDEKKRDDKSTHGGANDGDASTATSPEASDTETELPYILRIPLSEDNDFALKLDLFVDMPAAAYKRAMTTARKEEEQRRRSSLSITPEYSFLSAVPVDSGNQTTRGTTETTEAGTVHTTFSPEHFLWTMQQAPFTLSYMYGTNDISSSSTRTSYATIVSSAPRARCRSARGKRSSQPSQSDIAALGAFSEASIDAQTSPYSRGLFSGSRTPHGDQARSSISRSARLLSPSSIDSVSSGGGSSHSDSSSGDDDDLHDLDDLDIDDNESGDDADTAHAQRPFHGDECPLQRDETSAPTAAHDRSRHREKRRNSRAGDGAKPRRRARSRKAADPSEMLTVRLRVSFPSVRFIDKPEPLSLHNFLISQSPTRYGPPVRMALTVNILPSPVMIFRPTGLALPATMRASSAALASGQPPTALLNPPKTEGSPLEVEPVVHPECDVMMVQGLEGTAKAHLIIKATDLLHSVDFAVRCGDRGSAGRRFIMYSKEFLGNELGQYLLPSSSSSRPESPVEPMTTTGDRDEVYAVCADSQEEWAVPIILPYKLPRSTGELDVTLHLDVRLCCQPHRSFREAFPVRIVCSSARGGDGASRGHSDTHVREGELRTAVGGADHPPWVPTTVSATAPPARPQLPSFGMTPEASAAGMLSPPLIRSRVSSFMPGAAPASEVDWGALSLMRLAPPTHAGHVRFISTSHLRVTSFALCGGGALVMCAERVKGHQRSGQGSVCPSLQHTPVTPSLGSRAPSRTRQRHRHTYRSFLGFSPMNAMNSCIPINSVVVIPPAVAARIVEGGGELVRYLRTDNIHLSHANSGSVTPKGKRVQSPNSGGGGGSGHERRQEEYAFPSARAPPPPKPDGQQTLDLRHVMTKGWMFEVHIGEPRAHNTAIVRDTVTGECLVLRIGVQHLEEQAEHKRRETLSLPLDDPLRSVMGSGGNLSSRGSGGHNNNSSSAFGVSSLEVIAYAPPLPRTTQIAEQQFVSDNLAVCTRSWDGALRWWATSRPGIEDTLLSCCDASRVWELDTGDGLTLIVVVLGARCAVDPETGVVTCTTPAQVGEGVEGDGEDGETDTRTVGIFCLEEKRLLYHFEVLRPTTAHVEPPSFLSAAQMPSTVSRTKRSRSTRWRRVATGIEVLSRAEETGAVLYWDSESVVAVVCSPHWSHHEIFNVSSMMTSAKVGRGPVRASEGPPQATPARDGAESQLSASQSRAAPSVPTIVAVTSTTSLSVVAHAATTRTEDSESCRRADEWMAFVLLSDGRIVGLRYACLDAATTPPPPPPPRADEPTVSTPSPLPSTRAAVVGTVFNPAFVNPVQRVRDIVMYYYAVETTLRGRWSPLQSYTSVPSPAQDSVARAADAASPSHDVSAGTNGEVSEGEPGPLGVLYLYGVETGSHKLLKDAVVVEK